VRSGTVPVLLALVLVLVRGPVAVAGEPYDLETGREVALTAAGVGLVAASLLLQHHHVPLSEVEIAALRTGDLPAFDRSAAARWSPGAARASDWLQTVALLSPAVVLVDSGPQANVTPLTVAYLETVALNNGIVGLLKTLVSRNRPLVYNPDPRVPPAEKQRLFARRSFPSGHAANAFAGAMFLGEVYAGLHPDSASRHWVRYGSLGLAAATGYLRYAAGVHFPSDILVGAAIGAAVGWAVPRLHETGEDAGGSHAPAAAFALGFAF